MKVLHEKQEATKPKGLGPDRSVAWRGWAVAVEDHDPCCGINVNKKFERNFPSIKIIISRLIKIPAHFFLQALFGGDGSPLSRAIDPNSRPNLQGELRNGAARCQNFQRIIETRLLLGTSKFRELFNVNEGRVTVAAASFGPLKNRPLVTWRRKGWQCPDPAKQACPATRR